MTRLYAGLDVSLETTAICIVDDEGSIVRELVAPTDAEAIADVLEHHRAVLERIGLEAGPMSEWLLEGLQRQGFQVVQMETRQVHLALSASAVKTDRKDARGIAKLLRLGFLDGKQGFVGRDGSEDRSGRRIRRVDTHEVATHRRGAEEHEFGAVAGFILARN